MKYIKILLSILLLPFLYLMAGIIGYLIHFNGDTTSQEFPIYISSGEIHTEFVFDIESSPYDWKKFINPESLYQGDSSKVKYISLGQGDKRFFYEFFKLSDLTIELAFHGAFVPSQTAIHVEYSRELSSSLRYYKFSLDKERYMALVKFITDSFEFKDGNPIKIDNFNYYGRDGFFWGSESYHLLNTCNMWTAKGLKIANLPRPLWAPFRYSIDRSLKDYKY